MDGSVRQPADEGKKGPLEALFEAPPRRPLSPLRDPIADRRAAAAAQPVSYTHLTLPTTPYV